MALRDDIRSFIQSAPKAVLLVPTPELPQWDGQIYVGRVNLRQIASLWQKADGEEATDERAAFVVAAACDSAGSRIFQPEDILWLSTCEQLTPMVERLYWAAREQNGLTEANRTLWRKNSPGTAGAGSPSCCAALAQPGTDSTSTAC
jgi:hypothetical protein